MNSRHPCPRRVCTGGSALQDPRRFRKLCPAVAAEFRALKSVFGLRDNPWDLRELPVQLRGCPQRTLDAPKSPPATASGGHQ